MNDLAITALRRLYLIIQHEMKDWMLENDARDELAVAMKEAKTVLYPKKTL